MKNRYPGPRPFTNDDQSIFFGRDSDKANLNDLVLRNKVTVLFGRSGYGKSSLIQAGVIPHFKDTLDFKVIELRFQLSDSQPDDKSPRKTGMALRNKANPTTMLIAKLKDINESIDGSKDVIFSEISPNDDLITAWQLFKSIQWKVKQNGQEGVILVLDQFEELFNFRRYQYEQLFSELASLVFDRIPDTFKTMLSTRLSDGEYKKINADLLQYIEQEQHMRFLIGIRSDKLYLLDELGEKIPGIFDIRFGLKPLPITAVREIMEKPAALSGDFRSVSFKFRDGVIKKVEDFLKSRSQEATIEALDLQIICRAIENLVVIKMEHGFEKDDEVTDEFLPADLDDYLKDYYKDCWLEKNAEDAYVFNKIDRLLGRYLIERKLIDHRGTSSIRVSIDAGSLQNYGIEANLLEKIKDTRLVRKDLNTIELSHDTLIKPILHAGLGTIEDQLRSFYLELKKGRGLKSTIARVEKVVIKNKKNRYEVAKQEIAGKLEDEKFDAALRVLLENHILIDKNDKYILNHAMHDPFDKLVTNVTDARLMKIIAACVVLGMLVLVCIGLFVNVRYLLEEENAYNVARKMRVLPGGSEDAEANIHLYHKISRIIPNDSTLRDNFVNQFANAALFGLRVDSSGMNLAYPPVVNANNSILAFYVPNVPGGKPQKRSFAGLYDKDGKSLAKFSGYQAGCFFSNYPDELALFKGNRVLILSNDDTASYLLDLSTLPKSHSFAGNFQTPDQNDTASRKVERVTFLYKLKKNRIFARLTVPGMEFPAIIDLNSGTVIDISRRDGVSDTHAIAIDASKNEVLVNVSEAGISELLKNDDFTKLIVWGNKQHEYKLSTPFIHSVIALPKLLVNFYRIEGGRRIPMHEDRPLPSFYDAKYLSQQEQMVLTNGHIFILTDEHQNILSEDIVLKDSVSRILNAGKFDNELRILYSTPLRSPNEIKLVLYNHPSGKQSEFTWSGPGISHAISTAWFSKDGENIFFQVTENGRTRLFVLQENNHTLNVVTMIQGDQIDNLAKFSRTVAVQSNNAMVIVDLDSPNSPNALDVTSISQWLRKRRMSGSVEIKVDSATRSLGLSSGVLHKWFANPD